LSALNFIAAFALVSHLFKDVRSASLGAFIFAFSLALHSQLLHAQTFPRFAIPLTILFALRFLKNFKVKDYLWCLLLVVFQLFSGIYLGMMLSILTFFIFAVSLFNQRIEWITHLKEPKWLVQISLYSILALIPLIWLAIPYVKMQAEAVPESYKSVFASIPSFKSLLSAPDQSLLWNSLRIWNSEFEVAHDHQLFVGILPFLCLGYFLFQFIRTRPNKATNFKMTNGAYWVISLTGSLLFLLFLRVGEFSAYQFIYHIPGFQAMRSMSRIINLELIFTAILVSWTYLQFSKKWRLKPHLLFCAGLILLTVDNYVVDYSSVRTAVLESTMRTNPMEAAAIDLKHGSVLSYEPKAITSPSLHYHLDAMLVAQTLDLKTVNAYTARFPASYQPFAHDLSPDSRQYWLQRSPGAYDTLFVMNDQYSISPVASIGQESSEAIVRNIKEREISQWVNRIKADSNWMKDIEAKALDRQISVDSILRLDAVWMIEN
jgi:hypothetical protein